jgi:hypothetical protein
VWLYFANLCVNQHTKIDNLNSMKICIACRSKQREKCVSVGGANRKISTSAKLANHLQQVHLTDGQYKAYLDVEKARLAKKVDKAKQSKDTPYIVMFANNNKAIIKWKYQLACARWIVGTHQPLNTCDMEEFKKMVSTVSKVKLPGTDSRIIKTILNKKYYEVIEGMKKQLVETPFALTVDHWISKSKVMLGAMTVQTEQQQKMV